jgi:hypothetical protein
MSDPIPPPTGPSSRPEPPSPFDGPGRSEDRGDGPFPPARPGRTGGSGVKKPLLIGCGVILLLVVGAMAYFLTHPEVLIVWTLEAIHEDLESRLPEDLPDDLRARYEGAYERAVVSAREEPLTPASLQRVERLQKEYTGAVKGGGARLSVEEVERITAALEAFGGGDDEGSETEPEPESDLEPRPAPEQSPGAEG